jgi:hypothetical protein
VTAAAPPAPPPRKPFASFWDFCVRAYRPVAAWVAIGTALVNGMVLPMLPVFGVAPVAIDWVGVSTFLGVLLGPIGVARTIEKLNGVTS